MTLVVVDQAEEVFLDAITAVDMRLVLFTNDATTGLTPDEVDELTEADLTVATFPGYAPAVLTGGAWTTTIGNPSFARYATQTFTRSSSGTAEAVRGYALLRDSDGFLFALEQFPGPVDVEDAGDEVDVEPRIDLDDTRGHAVEAGTIVMTGRATAPLGWLLCNGAAVSRTTYADLFAAVGTTYGAGDGSTTFNVPDLRQRFPLGRSAGGTGAALGATGGSIDHVHSLDTPTAAALIESQASSNLSPFSRRKAGVTAWLPTIQQSGGGNATAYGGGTTTNATALQGNTDADNPPFVVVNYKIKV